MKKISAASRCGEISTPKQIAPVRRVGAMGNEGAESLLWGDNAQKKIGIGEKRTSGACNTGGGKRGSRDGAWGLTSEKLKTSDWLGKKEGKASIMRRRDFGEKKRGVASFRGL